MPLPAIAQASHRGVALGLFASADDYNYATLLDGLVQLGCADVLLVVPFYQPDVHATFIAPKAGFSPAPANTRRTIRQARARGLNVTIMPLVRLASRTPTEWRGVLAPSDPNAWFIAWSQVVWNLATMAQSEGAVRLVVGTEFASLEPQVGQWSRLIAGCRQRFSGRLLYSANWDHYLEVPFWSLVDEIGITGYFRLTSPGSAPDIAAIEARWRQRFAELDRFAASHARPWLFTEIGWPALATAASHPWDDTRASTADVALQATLWAAFTRAIEAHPTPPPFFAWNWFGPLGSGDHGFGLRGRPASRVLAKAFARWSAR